MVSFKAELPLHPPLRRWPFSTVHVSVLVQSILATLHLFPNEANRGSESMCFSPSHRKQLSCCRLVQSWADLMPEPAGRVSGEERAPPLQPAPTKPITWANSTCHASQLHSEHGDINKEPALLQQGTFLAPLLYFTITVLINRVSLLYVLGLIQHVEGYGCRWMIWYDEMVSVYKCKGSRDGW